MAEDSDYTAAAVQPEQQDQVAVQQQQPPPQAPYQHQHPAPSTPQPKHHQEHLSPFRQSTAEEIGSLTRKVNELTHSVEKLANAQAPRKPAKRRAGSGATRRTGSRSGIVPPGVT